MGRRSGVPHRRDELESLSPRQLDDEIARLKSRLRFLNGEGKESALRRLAAVQKIREQKAQAAE